MQGAGVTAPRTDGQRDPRFDLLRGLLVLLMIFGHLNWRQLEVHFHLGFVTVAEGFFLISGATLGMVERRRWERLRAGEAGTDVSTRLLLRRAVWLYAANLAGVLLARLLDGTRPFPNNYFDRYWGEASELVRWLSFDQPSVLNVLPRYAAFLLVAPLAVALLRRGQARVLALISVGLWLAGYLWQPSLLLPLFETARAPYPAVMWQLIFFGGMVLGWHATVRNESDKAPAWSPWLTAAAGSVLLVMIYVEANPQLFDPATLTRWTARSWLGPLRMVNLAAVALLVWDAVSRWAPGLLRISGRLVVPYGRSALQAFLLHSPLVWLLLAIAALDHLQWARTMIAVAVIFALLPVLQMRWVTRWLRP